MIYVELDHSKIAPETFKRFTLLKQTLSLIKIAHNGQTYNNLPYWHHPVRVMLRLDWYEVVGDDIYAALLHDALEDTPTTEGDLKNFGYSPYCIEMIKAVTRNKDEETYKMFIERIIASDDYRVMRLKLADLYENSNNVRFLPPEKRTIMVRYGLSIRDLHDKMRLSDVGIRLGGNTISGELDRTQVERWIGEQPAFV